MTTLCKLALAVFLLTSCAPTANSQAAAFLTGGKFRQIAISGATQTLALGINDGGAIVGWYSQSGPCNANNCAFVLVNGRYASFSYPGAAGTTAYGINASGQVVGSYTFDFNTYHGFVTSPITNVDFP